MLIIGWVRFFCLLAFRNALLLLQFRASRSSFFFSASKPEGLSDLNIIYLFMFKTWLFSVIVDFFFLCQVLRKTTWRHLKTDVLQICVFLH